MIRQFVPLNLLCISWAAAPGGLALAATSPALVSSVTVRYNSVDLHGEAGLTRFYGRLQEAARASCASLPGLDRWTVTARSRCEADTLEAAVSQVHMARLTAHHRACQRNATDRRCSAGGHPGSPGRGDFATS